MTSARATPLNAYLEGEAFISPSWWRCCSGSAQDTGVTVEWSNLTTGMTRPASQRATYCWLFQYFLCGHEWSAAIPLAPGPNEILITASDPSGNIGYAPITLTPEPDTTAPLVTTVSPAPDAVDVAVNTRLAATFSEPMDRASLTAATFVVQGPNGDLVTGTVTSTDTTATFTPDGDLAYSTAYTAAVTTGARDLRGNPLASSYTWSFTTGHAPDTTPPSVISTSPPDDADDVVIDTALTVSFSEPMSPASINPSTFVLRDPNDDPVPGSVTYMEGMATFAPAGPLVESTRYSAAVTTGAMDLAGNPLTADFAWRFTTAADTTSPTVISTSPASGATCVAMDDPITAVFSEPMDPTSLGTPSFLVRDGSGNAVGGSVDYEDRRATFTPFSNLAAFETYTATVTTGVKDLAGNALAADRVWTFDTVAQPSGTWLPTSTGDAPSGRASHSAVWTGSEMIVWGGLAGAVTLSTGGRYDPAADSWRPTSIVGAPAARSGHTAVWTGTEMLVWSGDLPLVGGMSGTGGRYDPSRDVWVATSTAAAPSARLEHTAVWTGTEMIIWGGNEAGDVAVNTGARYDPSTDTWRPVSVAGAPSASAGHSAVWTGTEMIVWGGDFYATTGGGYDPSTDTWRPISLSGAPSSRKWHSAVWTGSEMIIWGGWDVFGGGPTKTGARYDPDTDTWATISATCAPAGRYRHASVWTGAGMVAWGGLSISGVAGSLLASGATYDPLADTWTATPYLGAPTARAGHTGIWAERELIIWGGSLNSGARYRP